ncbi:MAG: MarR family transcriptional regulator [Alphaproteobacteria bacterium]|jgi:DNA-binding MarR family transcriptional regulator|nr:MarR family transcriptional regulator [Alphaproteobacteria bacterium]MDP6831621.1 MarR family transcriptional regulator [Alphaproteobacteria bacterium]MDP6875839.1 MarR family transcriptional regulator [Alphaproteobacteria bacterium]
MAKTTDDPVAFRFFNEIGIIEQLARALLERNLPDGLKISQFSVLNHLARAGERGEEDWGPARLASAFQVTKGAMTNTLQRLENRGLVLIQADPRDGRGKHVSITDAGRIMRGRCVENVGPLLGQLSREVSDEDFAAALPFLEKIRIYLDSHRS